MGKNITAVSIDHAKTSRRRDFSTTEKGIDMNFLEAIDEVINNKELVVGENFKHGCYFGCCDGVVTLFELSEDDIHTRLGNPCITRGLIDQGYRKIACASRKELGL